MTLAETGKSADTARTQHAPEVNKGQKPSRLEPSTRRYNVSDAVPGSSEPDAPDLSTRRAELDDRLAEMRAEREQQADARQAGLDQRAADLDQREAAIATEREHALAAVRALLT